MRRQIPIDIDGMGTEKFGGLGDLPHRRLHETETRYRFFFNPIRYTSLGLAVIEAMMIGMPVVALATTELPTVIEHGRTGYLSCELPELVEHMRHLLKHPEQAARMGEAARRVAQARFGLDRFVRDWNAAFRRAMELRQASPRLLEEVRRG
jgi:glycosyltransferase involved in cell wall biosynthesis